MSERGLTPKQARFVEEYLVDLNATQAYRRAGYSARTDKVAAANAAALLANHKVAAAIQARRDRLSKKLEITQERVLQELARIAFADVRNLFTWDEERACYVPSANLTDDEAAAISEIQAETVRYTREDGESETKIKLKLKTYDKKGALDSIAKHLGMFVERVEHSGKNGGPIEVQELTDADLVQRARTQAARLAILAGHTNGNGHLNGNGNGNGKH
jgi:phage terminase small subunit